MKRKLEVARQKTFTPYQIQQAFRILRESLAIDNGIDWANGRNFSVREIEMELMDILIPPKETAANVRAKLDVLKDASLDEVNDALFG